MKILQIISLFWNIVHFNAPTIFLKNLIIMKLFEFPLHIQKTLRIGLVIKKVKKYTKNTNHSIRRWIRNCTYTYNYAVSVCINQSLQRRLEIKSLKILKWPNQIFRKAKSGYCELRINNVPINYRFRSWNWNSKPYSSVICL